MHQQEDLFFCLSLGTSYRSNVQAAKRRGVGSTAACHMAESEKKIFKLFISNYVNFVLQQILVQGLL
jgi:hypothetical protein